MTRISQSDQALLLLRARLQELGRARRTTGAVQSAGKQPAPVTAQGRLVALKEIEGLSEDDRHRLFVRSLMLEAFGEAFANDAKFLTLAEDVFRVLSSSDDGRQLLRLAIEQL